MRVPVFHPEDEDLSVGHAGVGPQRRLLLAVAHHEGAGSQIAQALMLPGREDGNHADRIEEGNLIDIADEVARHRFEDSDGATRSLNHANARDALARRAPVPECFEQSEVAPVEAKRDSVKMATVH